ncbi:MAG: hypothetical protein FWB94_04890 [Chitinispirillia bacterium]|nr:hypothetical protein [Chitinispirillia bacterium]
MMIRKVAVALACACAVVFSLTCQNAEQAKAKDPLVRVGKVTIAQGSFDLFRNKIMRIYPVPLPYYFPGQRRPETFMAEVEAIWQHVKSDSLRNSVKSSLDWKWKELYFMSAPFFDLLNENLGFSDAELEARYKKDPEEYRAVTQTEDGKDSSFIPPFDRVKRMVADKVFYEKYPPDSAFIAGIDMHDHDHDENSIRNYWLYHVRSNPGEFFMRQFFFERNGAVYESEDQIYSGDGSKSIQSDDIDIIRSWVPSNRRNMRMKDLIEWLYKWQIFAEEAKKRGLTNTHEMKETLGWVLRVEHAAAYLRGEVEAKFAVPEMDQATRDFAELVVFDQMGRVGELNSMMVQSEVDNILKARVTVAVDSAIYLIRKSVGVSWLQEEYKDERGSDPVKLFAKADSLREAAASGEMEHTEAAKAAMEAENLFRTVAMEFAFTAEGRRAMTEMAKMLVDRYSNGPRPERFLLNQAIGYYRRSQVLDTDIDALCNSHFMVGFTYDELLGQSSLAEANYKWILRNASGCSLASDAEFMLLHLGETMTSIEEIRGQSIRQGRKVDDDEDDAVENVGENTAG